MPAFVNPITHVVFTAPGQAFQTAITAFWATLTPGAYTILNVSAFFDGTDSNLVVTYQPSAFPPVS